MGTGAWVLAALFAAPWYVDGDATACPGDGSDNAPFCSLADAVDLAELAPGDELLLRDAATAYAGASINGTDGEEGAPLVIRPDDGHAPVLSGGISLTSASYWTVRGLTFDGQDLEQSHVAIGAGTGGDVMEGLVVEGNTILGWGGPLIDEKSGDDMSSGIINIYGADSKAGSTMIGPVIRNNRVLSSRGKGLRVNRARDAVIEGNEFGRLTCQLDGNGPGMSSMHVHNAQRATIGRNYIHDFDASDCAYGGTKRVVGVWLQGSDNAEVHHNFLVNLGGEDDTGLGIQTMNGADDASVHHNIIVNADLCGLCNGVMASGGGRDGRYVHNTVVGGSGRGLDLTDGETTVWLNNIVEDSATAQVRVLQSRVTAYTVDRNLYRPPTDTERVGSVTYSDGADLATWQSDCNCDADSIVDDPRLPGPGLENFTPQPGSVAIDGGMDLPEGDRFNGEGSDLGAIEAPILVGASIRAPEPDRIRLDLQSETSPLQYDPGCAGFTVTIDGAPVATTTCELDGDDRLLIGLVEPAHQDDAVQLSYAGSAISNTDAIGGFIHGLLRPFEVEVDNASDEPAPPDPGGSDTDDPSGTDASTGPATTGATASTTAATTEAGETHSEGETGAGAAFPGVDGCACSSRRPVSNPLGWLLLGALGWRRRR